MKILQNYNERLESKAHGAQRQRHTNWVGDERAPCNAASGRVAAWPPGTHRPTPCGCIELRSKFWEIF
jgi:hypothetical protein